MRPLTKESPRSAAASLALFAVACNKGPAEAALKAADQALAAAKPEIEMYAPEELGSLTTAVREAARSFEKGNYTDALKAAQAPAREDPGGGGRGRREEEPADGGLERDVGLLPTLVQSITTKVAGLAAAKKPAEGHGQGHGGHRPDRPRVGDPGLDRGHRRLRGRGHPEGRQDRAGRQGEGRGARGDAGPDRRSAAAP